MTGNMIAQVGTISANHDETIGTIIAEAMEKVGKDGVITVEEGRTLETSLELVDGMQFDRGYPLAYFVTNPERMEVVLENPLILIHETKIRALTDLVPLLERVVRIGQPLLIIAEDLEGTRWPRSSSTSCGAHAGGGREGAGLRRSTQGHARGHRHPDRRAVHRGRSRNQA